MMALSKIFYNQVKRGFITVEDINIPIVKKEVLELIAEDEAKQKEQEKEEIE